MEPWWFLEPLFKIGILCCMFSQFAAIVAWFFLDDDSNIPAYIIMIGVIPLFVSFILIMLWFVSLL